jgi:hypothetical protein
VHAINAREKDHICSPPSVVTVATFNIVTMPVSASRACLGRDGRQARSCGSLRADRRHPNPVSAALREVPRVISALTTRYTCKYAQNQHPNTHTKLELAFQLAVRRDEHFSRIQPVLRDRNATFHNAFFIPHARSKPMSRLLLTLTLISGLCGCVYAPPYGYYAPAPGYYGYAPAYYAAPPVSIGIGGVFHIH